MAVVNEVVTKFSFVGNLAPQQNFNKNLTSSIKLLSGMALGIGAAAAGMTAWASSVLGALDPMIQLSRTTKVAVEDIQSLGYIASVNGSSVSAMESSISGLSKSIGDASRGIGRGKMAFEDLGISVTDSNGKVKTADVVMNDLRNRFAEFGTSMEAQQSIAGSLGIDRTLIQTLNLTDDAMASLTDKAYGLGVITKQQADDAATYNDALTTLKRGLSGIQNQMAVGMAPAMTEVAEAFTQLLIDNRDWIVNGLQYLARVLAGTIGMFKRLAPMFAAIAAGFLVAKIATLGFGGALGIVLSPVVLITAAVVALILIIDDLVNAFQGGNSVIVDFFAGLGIDILPAIMAIGETIKSVFSAVVALFTGDFEGAFNHLGDAFKTWTGFIWSIFKGLIDLIMGAWSGVLGYIKKLAMNLLPDWVVKLLGGTVGGGDSAMATMPAAEAVRGGNVSSSSSNIEQQVSISIATNDPQRAGTAVADNLQKNLKDARMMANRGGY